MDEGRPQGSAPLGHALFLLFINVYVFGYIFLFFRLPAGGAAQELLRNGANLLTMFFATLAAVIAWRRLQGEERHVWMWLCAGMVLWSVAELVWGLFDAYLFPRAPDFSLADVFWLLGYVAVGEALALHLRALWGGQQRTRIVLATLGGFVLPLLLFVALLWPTLSDPNLSLELADVVTALYPALDLLLATQGLLVLLMMRGQVWWCPWFFIGVALLLWAFSDAWYWVLIFFDRFGLNPRSVLSVDIPDSLGNLIMGYAALQALRPESACAKRS
ncbi:MAG: hypothetical protein ACLFU8_12805 [Anaerolineales bacterium]